jgi:hypothetical protein
MGKYSKANFQTAPPKRPWAVHPIWRGIGCIWLILSPLLAYALASLLVEYDMKSGFFALPGELTSTVIIPLTRFSPAAIAAYVVVKDLAAPHLFANLMVAGLILIIGFGIVMVIYAIIYSISGPKRLGPLDAPPIRRKTRRSR